MISKGELSPNEAIEDVVLGTDEEEEDHEFSFDEEPSEDLHAMLSSFFTEEKKNRNMVDVLLEIKRTIETHNRILLKICNHLTQQPQAAPKK